MRVGNDSNSNNNNNRDVTFTSHLLHSRFFPNAIAPQDSGEEENVLLRPVPGT